MKVIKMKQLPILCAAPIFALAFGGLSGGMRASAQTIVDTDSASTYGLTGDVYHLSTSSSQLGVSFTIDQSYTVSSLGYYGGLNSGGSIFLDIVQANPTTYQPLSQNLSNLVYSTTITSDEDPGYLSGNNDVGAAPESLVLASGTYDLIVGSTVASPGGGYVNQTTDITGTQELITGSPFNYTVSTDPASSYSARLFVDGSPYVSAPEASSLIASALLAAFSTLGLSLMSKNKAS